MSTILHILNGDDTLKSFVQTGLDGDVLVWREVLSEGPITGDIDSAGFWNQRSEWISQSFGGTPEGYNRKVIDELAKLNGSYEEINLWFEFDLHCQMNLLGVLMLLKKQVDLSQPRLFLISPDDYPEVTDFRGMGQLNAAQLEDLYDGRLSLSELDFYVADQAWQLLTSGNNAELKQWLDTNRYWGNLHWLRASLEAHLNRSSRNAAGLNGVEQILLSIYQTGIVSRHELYEHFWRQYPIYGMGDREIDLYLNHLQQQQLIQLHD